MTDAQREALDAALISGERERDIVHRLRLPRTSIARRTRLLREAGKLDHRPKRQPRKLIDAMVNRMPLGSIQDVLRLLTEDELEWLKAITPGGSSIAVAVASIVKDAAWGESNG